MWNCVIVLFGIPVYSGQCRRLSVWRGGNAADWYVGQTQTVFIVCYYADWSWWERWLDKCFKWSSEDL